MKSFCCLVLLSALAFSSEASAETKDEWIALGARIHGAFGPFIPVGIRIGLDAVDRLKPGTRDLTVTYYNGHQAAMPLHRGHQFCYLPSGLPTGLLGKARGPGPGFLATRRLGLARQLRPSRPDRAALQLRAA